MILVYYKKPDDFQRRLHGKYLEFISSIRNLDKMVYMHRSINQEVIKKYSKEVGFF